ECTSPVSVASTASKSVGKELHRLKQRRQPWQMSKTRSSSFWSAASSVNCGLRQSRGWREGACRLPSRIPVSDALTVFFESDGARSDRVERLLEAIRVRALGLGQR